MLGPVIDHLWQSTLVVIAAAGATLLLRRYGARWRYWIWFAASMKFVVPFALIVGLGGQLAWREAPANFVPSGWRALAAQALTPTTTFGQSEPPGRAEYTLASSDSARLHAGSPTARDSLAGELVAQLSGDAGTATSADRGSARESDRSSSAARWSTVLLAVWALGTCFLMLRWAWQWLGLRGIVRRSKPLAFAQLESGALEIRTCPSIMEPGIFGIFRPVLLIPEGIVNRLAPRQLDAIVRHERIHVEHRDNLTAALHMLVEAVFWFHPFVWWIGSRLVDERERACDEAVLAAGTDPTDYASGLIGVCDYYTQSPLLCTAGVGGGSLEGRVKRITENVRLPALGRAARAVLIVAPAMIILAPLAVGLFSAPAVRAQSDAGSAEAGLFQCLDPHVLKSLLLPSSGQDETVYTTAVPLEMSDIAVPAGFDWIGSMRRDSRSPALGQITAAYRTDAATDDARTEAAAALERGGWEQQQPARMMPSSGAVFPSSVRPQPSLFCLGAKTVNLNVDALDGTTYVTYVFPTGPDGQCSRDPQSRFVSQGMLSAYMPQLVFPPDPETGEPPRGGGSGMSSSTGSQQNRTEIKHSASIDVLASHLAQQLVDQGWRADASWQGATTAGSAWSRQFEAGAEVQGTLDITKTRDSEYTVMFRAVAIR